MEIIGQIGVFILFALLAAVVAYGLLTAFKPGQTDPTARGDQGNSGGASDKASGGSSNA